MRDQLALPADTPEGISRIALIGHAVGAAVFVTGADNRFEAANDSFRRFLPCCDIDQRPLFPAAFLKSIEAGVNDDPEIIDDPVLYLQRIERFRLSERAVFIKNWGEKRAFCIHHRCGEWTTRISIPLNLRTSVFEKKLRELSDVELFISMQMMNANLVAALEETPQPTAFLSCDARVSYWNRAMLQHLKSKAGLKISSCGQLCAPTQVVSDRLHKAVAQRATSYSDSVTLVLQNESGSLAQLTTVSSAGPGLAMIQLPAPSLDETALAMVLRSIGLSAGRAKIAAAIGLGIPIEEIASKSSRSADTVRTEVRNICQFIYQNNLSASRGIRAIVDLVSRLATIAGKSSNF